MLTSGFTDLHRAVPFTGEFRAAWGAELHFGEDGAVDFPRRILTHAEKAL